MRIRTRLSRCSIFNEILACGYSFLGYTWVGDRVCADEEIYISKDKNLLLWLNFISGDYTLYRRIPNEPECEWQKEPLFSPENSAKGWISKEESPENAFVVKNWRYIKLILENGETLYFEQCSGFDMDDEIVLKCDDL